jgi:zinc protease
MVRHFLVDEAMPGILAELRLHETLLPTIDLAEMNAVARGWIGTQGRVLLVQAPQQVTLPPQEALLATFAKVEGEELTAYVDRVSDAPLIAVLPPPGVVTREHTHPTLDLTEWQLSNGMTVLVKPTDFKNDEILVRGFTPGGHSLVADRDHLSALFAADLVDASGAGAFGPTELRNKLAGKIASASPSISELESGIGGRASPQDLETMLRLVHLAFTAPRRDEQVFAAFRARLADALARKDSDPGTVFADRRERIIHRDHPRRRPLVKGDELKIELDRALAIYRRRFARPGAFTFVFVGRFDPATLRPLVERYLGSLPRGGAPERWRDVGVRTIGAPASFEVRQGLEPKSTVSLTFTARRRWTREEAHRISSLAEALSIRLREVIREDLGGTYGVDVASDFDRRPVAQVRTDITFSCAPDNVERLTAAVLAEIESARTSGPGSAYVDKVKAAQHRALDAAVKTNGYWLGRLVDHARFGTDPVLILREEELIDALTPEALRDSAAATLHPRRVVRGVLRPASRPPDVAAGAP